MKVSIADWASGRLAASLVGPEGYHQSEYSAGGDAAFGRRAGQQDLNDVVELRDLPRLLGDLRLQLRVQPLDGGERRAVGVDGRDRLVVIAETERGAEVLRRRADVPDLG